MRKFIKYAGLAFLLFLLWVVLIITDDQLEHMGSNYYHGYITEHGVYCKVSRKGYNLLFVAHEVRNVEHFENRITGVATRSGRLITAIKTLPDEEFEFTIWISKDPLTCGRSKIEFVDL